MNTFASVAFTIIGTLISVAGVVGVWISTINVLFSPRPEDIVAAPLESYTAADNPDATDLALAAMRKTEDMLSRRRWRRRLDISILFVALGLAMIFATLAAQR